MFKYKCYFLYTFFDIVELLSGTNNSESTFE